MATSFAAWREQCGLELQDVATEFDEPIDKVRSWESGLALPPERVLRTLSIRASFSPDAQPAGSGDASIHQDPAVRSSSDVGNRKRKAQLGQFLTPDSVASFMASLFTHPWPEEVQLLDAGAGVGTLTQAFVSKWKAGTGRSNLTACAYEIDEHLLPQLRANLGKMDAGEVVTRVISADFITEASTAIRMGNFNKYTHAILNPPYRKIGTSSSHRAYLRLAGLETVNLYTGFVGLAVEMLSSSGELVAIIPRSFCNGPYYEPFRHFILDRTAILQIHLFSARDKAFSADAVLQENVIIHLKRGVAQGPVVISVSTDDTFSDYSARDVPFEKIVATEDRAKFIHIPTDDNEHLLMRPSFRFSLDDLGINVSTGPVVDFRLKESLRPMPTAETVPLLYPAHFVGGRVVWPKHGFKKANAILRTPATEKWLFPNGFYTVVRRFSSKEERRRIVASVVDPNAVKASALGFENHLNVFHAGKKPLSEDFAHGLAIYLNSSAVDRYFRQFNGHTQVNATDLRAMRYPSREALVSLGKWAAAKPGALDSAAIDQKVMTLG
ncbi:MAG: Eco57I restriction-modification methylase domain-containing protein [Allosphingosinicella sp.]